MGSGTMTPVSPGIGSGATQARPIPYTLLSLPRFAEVMGINPVHFAGAQAGDIFPYQGTCNDFWHKYQWQDADRTSKMDLAENIQEAEREIAEFMGYWPAPKWFEDEPHRYPQVYRPDRYGTMRDVKGYYKAVRLGWGRLVQPGIRAVSLVGTATTGGGSLQYTDEDSDGFYETATITLPTSLTNEFEIKVYFPSEGGDQDWEVRPVRSKTISGGNIVIILDSWLLIDPILYDEFPNSTDVMTPIDITTVGNFVTSVDVYREYTDSTAASATLFWEPGVSTSTCLDCGGTGCTACTLTSQDGCMFIREPNQGAGAVSPATYDSDSGTWQSASLSVCREPDMINVSYYAGDISDEYKKNLRYDPLSNWWAKIIAEMATARLERPFCTCKNLLALQEKLREDLIYTARGTGTRYVTQQIQESPFGSLRGEVNAWMKLRKIMSKRRARSALI